MQPDQTSSFPAPYDRTAKITSATVCAVMLIVTVVTRQAVVGGVGLLILGLAYAFSPRSYSVAGGSVVVRRLVGELRVPLEGVREARPAAGDDFSGCIRLWGNGGLFGYYGLFRTSKLGKCRWYVTDRSRAVVIVTETKTALFSPEDVSGFLAAVQAAAPGPLTGPSGAAPLSYESGGSGGKYIGVAVVLVVLLIMAFTFLYAPDAPGYTLTSGALTIHDKFFYPVTVEAAEVDVAGIRIVDFTREPEWRPTARTNGFGILHYASGWFRLASGRTVRMYRADGHRLVLLPGRAGGATVLYEAQRPEEFVGQVQREWAGRE